MTRMFKPKPVPFDGPDRPEPKLARPRSVTAADLQNREFEPIRWAVPDLVPAGLTILAGKPKLGKSWFSLDLAVACAQGTVTLGDRICPAGDVLYAALEDGDRRLKDRLSKVVRVRTWPARLTFWTEMNRLEDGGLQQLDQWLDEAHQPRLVVVDTFAKARSPKGRDENAYDADYRQAGALKQLADHHRVAIIVVHHVRKMEADDPLDAVSGTTGLTGAPDTILVLKRESSGVTLYGRGRDIEEIELAVEFERDVCRWRVLGDAGEVRTTEERKAVLDALLDAGEPMTPLQIAAVTGCSRGNIRRLVTKMATAGEVTKLKKGLYAHPTQTSVTSVTG